MPAGMSKSPAAQQLDNLAEGLPHVQRKPEARQE